MCHIFRLLFHWNIEFAKGAKNNEFHFSLQFRKIQKYTIQKNMEGVIISAGRYRCRLNH